MFKKRIELSQAINIVKRLRECMELYEDDDTAVAVKLCDELKAEGLCSSYEYFYFSLIPPQLYSALKKLEQSRLAENDVKKEVKPIHCDHPIICPYAKVK